ncbi:facilitated trehalose transporter Tret1-like [Choristoneura fumiferana]|uniref:facilitated trehalose transporter Tret1-like n=1 Tax=Choristoneura fumiferana TaxID=7141 RepID=UPI003D15D359
MRSQSIVVTMAKKTAWITPYKKQCFVTAGVCLNMSSQGVVVGYAAILLPQLKRPGSEIPIDDSSGSWIASIMGFTLVAGNFIVPLIMANYGRKTANIISIIPMLIGWFGIVFAGSVEVMLFARALQGLAMGMSSSIGPVLIGEYASPKNRGAFLMLMSIAIGIGVLGVHTMGSFMTWQHTALICAIVVFMDLLIVIYSPETPSWLADQGRYDESRKVFRWLRGDGEEEELQRIVQTSVMVRESKAEISSSETLVKKIRRNIAYFRMTIAKKEFHKPIFIMIHIYTFGQWSGANILATYTSLVFENVIGPGSNVALLLITLGIQRVISNTSALIVIRKMKRRSMLLATGCINIFAYLSQAAYSYAKEHDMLPFDHPMIGVVLIHIHMFSIATGTIPLPLVLAGELFPLEFRSLAGGISVLFFSGNTFITIKTFTYLSSTLGLYGAYCLYAAVVCYSLVVALMFLPETKDRTLQDIEDEFRGRALSPEEVKATQSLTSLKFNNLDRRCSSPML